jgi:lipoprotein-releasing system ATP-binding protein
MGYQLSGGEKQRVAIARSMINDSLLFMCDEPASNLSSKNTNIVFHIFKELTTVYNKTLLEITHNLDFTNKIERIIELGDGKIIWSYSFLKT